MEWIISANGNKYDHASAFEKWGFIDWKQKVNYSEGDIIYIYCTSPYKKIMYKTVADIINMDFEETVNDKYYWKDISEYQNGKINGKYVRLKLISKFNYESLSLDNLKEHGLNAAPQGPIKVKPELRQFIEQIIDNKFESMFPEEINIKEIHEGIGKTIIVNKYERSRVARSKCIEYNGCVCKICGMDFYTQYGEVGKDFIHIHHTVPLNTIKEDYIVDYKNDLIPVCPNCHAMLHRKINGKYLSIDELKAIVNKSKIRNKYLYKEYE